MRQDKSDLTGQLGQELSDMAKRLQSMMVVEVVIPEEILSLGKEALSRPEGTQDQSGPPTPEPDKAGSDTNPQGVNQDRPKANA